MSEPHRTRIDIVSTSNAADRGFLALADLASATAGLPDGCYRVIGGHMVQALQHIYPVEGLRLRGTADADAGMGKEALVAAVGPLHEQMIAMGYGLECGNRYTKTTEDGRLDVDILVATYGGSRPGEIGGRAFDSAPGLHLAVVADSVIVEMTVHLRAGGATACVVPVPDVEAAVILKVLAWSKRLAAKDVRDLATLFEIVHQHRTRIRTWKLANAELTGTHRDTASALARLVSMVDRGQWSHAFTGSANAARFTALVRKYVSVDV